MNARYINYLFLFYILFSGLPYFSAAQTAADANPKDSILKVEKIADFALAGDGSAIQWNKAQWINLPQTEGKATMYTTQFKTVYSDSGIYCLFKCEDNKITATLTEDFADLYNEDVVEIFLHTDEKAPIYFEYELSPLNYELPIIVPNFNHTFFGWRPWHYEGNHKTRHAVHINKHGNAVTSWTAELFIPFLLLKPMPNAIPQKGTRWRANFYRIDYDNKTSEWSWQPTRKTFHEYEKFGTIEFQ
ncbi:MAG: carbohydrate-binding family 9-like protein [Bacteroidota bacterium]